MRRYLPLILAFVAVVVVTVWLDALPSLSDRFPAFLLNSFAGMHAWQWLATLVALATAVVGGTVARSVVLRGGDLSLKFLGVRLSDRIEKSFGRAALVLITGLLASILLAGLSLPDRYDIALNKLSQATTFIGIAQVIATIWDAFCFSLQARAAGHQRAERLLVPMVRKLVQAVIFVVATLAVMAVFISAARLSTLIAGLGVSGIVVALAAKDSVENLFGSITILLDMPFAIGDEVKIDKIEGTVEEINLRSTRIRTVEDTVVTLPNANLIRAAVENFGERRFRRQKFWLRLSYDNSPQAIDAYAASLKAFLEEMPETVDGQNIVELQDPGEPSIGLLVQCRLEVDRYATETALRDRILREALRLRETHGIVFAAAPRPLPPTPPAPTSGQVS